LAECEFIFVQLNLGLLAMKTTDENSQLNLMLLQGVFFFPSPSQVQHPELIGYQSPIPDLAVEFHKPMDLCAKF